MVEVDRTGSIDLPRRNCKVGKVKIKESSFEGTGQLVVGMKPFLIVQLLSAWSSLSHFYVMIANRRHNRILHTVKH